MDSPEIKVDKMVKLKVGDKFPDLKAEAIQGERSLSDFQGKNAVVYFYPNDGTPGCTIQAKDFRDFKSEFNDLNTEIIGISTNSIKSHKKFIEKYDLNFTLLSDKSKILCSACGVKGLSGVTAKRTTFLLDNQGKIRYIWENVKAKGHTEVVLKKIKELDLN
jgi:peroxiredoxin Q/BCP